MFFIKSGRINAVLPKYNNFEYLRINAGYFFGELDLLFHNEIRKFSIMAARDSELLVLSKKQFKNVFFIEFRNIGMSFIKNAYLRKERFKKTYQEAIKFCKQNKEIFENDENEEDKKDKQEQIYTSSGNNNKKKFPNSKVKNKKCIKHFSCLIQRITDLEKAFFL